MRSGARFACFVDGICCTDIHRLGPLNRADVRRLGLFGAGNALHTSQHGEIELRRTQDGRCSLLEGVRCSLHAVRGGDAKPKLCRRFPFALVATPLGGRVVTAHRCPCRTLGERPLLSPADAETSLAAPGGRLARDRDGPVRVQIKPRTTVSLATWADLEARLIERLAAGDPPTSILAVGPGLPALRSGSWAEIADEFTAFGAYSPRGCQALAWFGDGIALALGGQPVPRARPWAQDFDRAEARTASPAPTALILGDWLADLVWGLSWAEHGPFDRARAAIGALAVIAAAVAARIGELTVRADRAAAEALLVAEAGACHRLWAGVIARMEPATGWMTSHGHP